MSRIDRISEEMMRALSEEIRMLKDPRVSGLVSITRCDVTGDLRYAKVYVSVYGDEEAQKKVFAGLKSAGGFLRREVAKRINLRYIPEPIFIKDDSIVRGVHISKIINDLGIEKGEDADDANE